MAKLSAHGSEIGRIEYVTSVVAYMSDGKILENDGFGWKVRGTVKSEFTPQQAFDRARVRIEQFRQERTAYTAYFKAICETAGICNRWKLHAAIQMMPDDPDGVWSEACDGYGSNVSADVSEVVELCRLYRSAIKEKEELRAAHQPA